MGKDITPPEQNDTEDTTPVPPPCYSHKYVLYVGLLETYEYCERCDKKRPVETDKKEEEKGPVWW